MQNDQVVHLFKLCLIGLIATFTTAGCGLFQKSAGDLTEAQEAQLLGEKERLQEELLRLKVQNRQLWYQQWRNALQKDSLVNLPDLSLPFAFAQGNVQVLDLDTSLMLGYTWNTGDSAGYMPAPYSNIRTNDFFTDWQPIDLSEKTNAPLFSTVKSEIVTPNDLGALARRKQELEKAKIAALQAQKQSALAEKKAKIALLSEEKPPKPEDRNTPPSGHPTKRIMELEVPNEGNVAHGEDLVAIIAPRLRASEIDYYAALDLPPPPFSDKRDFDPKDIFPEARTFGQVNQQLRDMLNTCGYTEPDGSPRYHYLKTVEGEYVNGFAIVTDFEQIDQTGKFLDNRFSLETESEGYNNFIQYLVPRRRARGTFRFFAIVISDLYLSTDGPERKLGFVSSTMMEQPTELHYRIADLRLSKHTKIQVLVYEYQGLEGDEMNGYPVDLPEITALDHLAGAGLLKYFVP